MFKQEIAQLSNKILEQGQDHDRRCRDLESNLIDLQNQLEQVRQAKVQLERQATSLQELLQERDKRIKVGGTWKGHDFLKFLLKRHSHKRRNGPKWTFIKIRCKN